eukprot:TRINITY_DN27937_c0_g1_i1.p1 TRINITY_DN27937_c0_g1~~TRINITY_DN27937_c0_g1_i1.p1  ORF type:complete len:454 (+),score=94.75 TRINITY_DN27937_c0_g1_i1:114-1364(+)
MASSSAESGGSEIKLSAQDLAKIRTCVTCFDQGLKGLGQLRKEIDKEPDAKWVRYIPLNDAVKADTIPCLRYLVDDVKVETLNVKHTRYLPLELAIIWGKTEVMVFLLSRGADPMLGQESSVVDKARLRQQRLEEAHERAGDGMEFEGFSITKAQIEPLIVEGLGMLEILKGIESYGSYLLWAEQNGNHPLVKRFSGNLNFAEPRYQLAVLRALVREEKASIKSGSDRAALAAEDARKAAIAAKEEQPLIDALVEYGFSADAAKEIRDCFRLPTVKALKNAKLSAEDVDKRLEASVRTKRMTEGNGRKAARFVRELDDFIAAAGNKAAPVAKAAAKAPAAKAKTKAAAAPKANAALLAAMGAKGAGKGGYPTKAAAPSKEPQSKKAVGSIDGFEVMFRPDLPDDAFMHITCFIVGS